MDGLNQNSLRFTPLRQNPLFPRISQHSLTVFKGTPFGALPSCYFRSFEFIRDEGGWEDIRVLGNERDAGCRDMSKTIADSIYTSIGGYNCGDNFFHQVTMMEAL